MIQTAPKIGEMVLVVTAELSNNESNRYYIGPIISQPQRMEKDKYNYGRGSAMSTIKNNSVIEPLETIGNYPDTDGAFPKEGDVALIGRISEDIILKDSEIDIRCGARIKPSKEDEKGLMGHVVFNDKNPSYIRLKYHKSGKSSVSIVADETIVLSHKDADKLNGDISFADKDELIANEQYEAIVAQLHQVPYGDVLLNFLNLIRESMRTHVHPWPGLPPCIADALAELNRCDFESMLSQSLKIS